jgi:tetratricopeptide (TPR) repeat protein
MKSFKYFRAGVFVAALMLLTSNVSALTLGRLKGSAILGQPLDVTVSLQLSSQDDSSASCLDGVVFYGDVQQPAGRVKVVAKPASDPQTMLVSVSGSALVDEPSVTVTLRAGCIQKTTRRYVLLSELVSETASNASAKLVDQPVLAQSEPSEWQKAVSVTAPPPARSKAPTQVSDQAASGAAVPKVKRKVNQVASEDARKPTLNARVDRRSEKLDELQRRVDALAQRDASAVAQEEPQKYDDVIATVQTSLQSLQTLTLKNQKALAAINRTIDASQEKGSGDPWVYGFAGFLGVALVALIFFLASAKRANSVAGPWWRSNQVSEDDLPPQKDRPASSWVPLQAESTVSLAPKAAASSTEPGSEAPSPAVDIELGDIAPSGLNQRPTERASSANIGVTKKPDPRDFSPSGYATLQSVNIREMLDVRQQAEFFLALGQHAEAIAVLERSIEDSNQWNPLVLLDLLGILHTLGRRTDFDRYRQEFNMLFTGLVPVYPDFLSEGKGLESYSQILARLEALWPGESAAEYIEACLVRTPQDKQHQGFDLDAFRELLLLHGILRRLDAESDSNLAPFSTHHTSSTPISLWGERNDINADQEASIRTAPTVPFLQPGIAGPGLDLDLDFPTDTH